MSDRIGALTVGFTADVSVLHDDRGRFLLRDNEDTKVVADRLLRPAFCLRAGKRFEADSPILPQAIAAEGPPMTDFHLDDPTPPDPRHRWGDLDLAARGACYDNNAAVADSAAQVAARNARLGGVPAAHAAHLDIPYAGGERTAFDLYPAAEPSAPCLVFVHGGYWQRNARADFACFAAGLNAAGWSVAMPGYTLAPEASLGGIVAEIGTALDWLAAHGGEHGIGGPVVLSGLVGGRAPRRAPLGHPARGGGARDLRRLRSRPDPRHLPQRQARLSEGRDRHALAPAASGDGQADDARHGSRELPALIRTAATCTRCAAPPMRRAPCCRCRRRPLLRSSTSSGGPTACWCAPRRTSSRRAIERRGRRGALPRKEDDRLMRGRGQYVGDLRSRGCRTSPSCAARWRMPASAPSTCLRRTATGVFTAADLDGVLPIRAVSGLPGFKTSEQPILATGKVRQVGELVALCVAPTRAEAEDMAASVVLDLEELPAIHDMLAAREPGSPLVHEHLGRQRLPGDPRRCEHRERSRCTHPGEPHHLDGPPVHGADRGPGHRGPPRSSPRPTRRPHGEPDAAHRAQRPFRMSRHRAGAPPHRLARCRRGFG